MFVQGLSGTQSRNPLKFHNIIMKSPLTSNYFRRNRLEEQSKLASSQNSSEMKMVDKIESINSVLSKDDHFPFPFPQVSNEFSESG